MGKRRYVEATADGYYGGKRVAGKKFWLVDGKKEFSKKWMIDADPSSADPAPASSADEANTEHDEQVANLTKAVEVAEKERDAAKDGLERSEEARADLTAERDKLKADLEEATKPAPKPAEKPSGSSDKGGSGA